MIPFLKALPNFKTIFQIIFQFQFCFCFSNAVNLLAIGIRIVRPYLF